MKIRTRLVVHAACAAMLVLVPVAGRAQERATPQPQAGGPLVLERIDNGFVLAPDFKVTDIDGRLEKLAGGYAGWVTEDRLMFGGGAYWVPGSRDVDMVYGGFVTEWLTPKDHRIRFGAKGLVGGGRATLSDVIELPARGTLDDVVARFGRGVRGDLSRLTTSRRVRFREEFFVFEPQATVLLAITDNIGLDWAVGYRVIGGARDLDDRLEGASGSVALRVALK